MLITDPLKEILFTDNKALKYHAREYQGASVKENLPHPSSLPEAKNIIAKQHCSGCWINKSRTKYEYPGINKNLSETIKYFGRLIDIHLLKKDRPSIKTAAEYLFSTQTAGGDFRGILGNQYMPYYNGMIIEYLCKAGYGNDVRTIKALDWLLDNRQDDGGWTIPLLSVKGRGPSIWQAPPYPFEPHKKSSLNATGMTLRAFLFHEDYCEREEVLKAAELLKKRFFHADYYSWRKKPEYRLKFQFPFWWSNLLTSLDSLSLLGYSPEDPDIKEGLEWFTDNQLANGLWQTQYDKAGDKEQARWVALSVLKVFRRFSENQKKNL